MYLRNVILVAIVFAMASFAQPNEPTAIRAHALDVPIQVHYFANPLNGDSYINITNDGFNGDALFGPGGAGSEPGSICANVYVFDATDEQEVSCCSCLITPNAVASLKISQLTLKALTASTPALTTVKLVATLPPTGGCSASGLEASQTLAYGMLAWATTLTPGVSSGAYVTVETPFLPVALCLPPRVDPPFVCGNYGPANSNTDLASLADRCSFIVGNGGGSGQCTGCATGALGAGKM